MKDMLKLMKSSPFSEAQSIIVYCKFQVRMVLTLVIVELLYSVQLDVHA